MQEVLLQTHDLDSRRPYRQAFALQHLREGVGLSSQLESKHGIKERVHAQYNR